MVSMKPMDTVLFVRISEETELQTSDDFTTFITLGVFILHILLQFLSWSSTIMGLY